MRLFFRVLLPAVQVLFTLALLGTDVGTRPLFGPPRFRMASRCDWDPSAVCGPVVLPVVVTRFGELNLPAIPLLEQPYVWLGGPDRPNQPWLVVLVGFAGVGLWFFVGHFLDDLTWALRKRLSPGRRIGGMMISLFVIIASFIVWIDSDLTSSVLSSQQSDIRLFSLLWVTFGCVMLLLQVRWSRAADLSLGSFV
jgi:hypothetical protein